MKMQLSSRTSPGFSVARSFKLGSFHVGSSLGDLLTSAVWNRILISDLGVAAWPVALLSALRYFLAPLTLWAGHRSDTRPILGSRRVAYIWLGRLLMLLALPLLPLSVVAIARDAGSFLGWGLALVSFLLYGAGQLISGAPFLALVHDSAPYEKRGQAVGIVQLMLVVSFAFIPAIYAGVMPVYAPDAFARLVGIGMAGAAFFWFFSVWREERSIASPAAAQPAAPSFRHTFAEMWADPRARRYAVFLAASAFFAFMQDAMLEPFGGDVFGLAAGETTRFNAYWGMGVLISMVATLIVTRRRPPHRQTSTTSLGLALLALPILALGAASLAENLTAVRPILVLFGVGFGVFTVGGVSLLMAVNTEEHAGAYLALWSVIQLVARGAGIAMGGVIRDAALAASGQFAVAYASVFLIEGLGLLVCIWLLARVDVPAFARQARLRTAEVLATD
ncbi:MAG: BCD family MFS transporter [Anaerolineae bacterium]|nr:BCD family MFS transporter [Anaerolineae bacterium]